MSTFAEGAERLAGFAGAALGWAPGRFWDATPAELATVARALAGIGAGSGPPAGVPGDGALLARLRREFPDG